MSETITQAEQEIAKMLAAGRQKIAEWEEAQRQKDEKARAKESAEIAAMWVEPINVIRGAIPAWMHDYLTVDTEQRPWSGRKCARINLPDLAPIDIILDFNNKNWGVSAWQVRDCGIFAPNYETAKVVDYEGGPRFHELTVAMATAADLAQNRLKLQEQVDELNREREERAAAYREKAAKEAQELESKPERSPVGQTPMEELFTAIQGLIDDRLGYYGLIER